MRFIYRVEDAVLGPFIRALNHGLLSLLVRFSFLAVVWTWLWNSGLTKVYNSREGFSFAPKLGAYVQMFPKQMEAASFDISQLGPLYTAIAYIGTYGELILPILVVVGLLTRTAALGMIVFIVVLSVVDIYGHGADAETIGAWFDGVESAKILDVRTFWVVAMLVLVAKGGGWLSLDSLLKRTSQAEKPVYP